MVNVAGIAEERGITVKEVKQPAAVDFLNVITVRARDVGGELGVDGTTLGPANRPRFVGIYDHDIDIEPVPNMVFLRATAQVPGTFGKIGAPVGEFGVNISQVAVAPSKPGEPEVMGLAVSQPISDEQARAGHRGGRPARRETRDALGPTTSGAVRRPGPRRPPRTQDGRGGRSATRPGRGLHRRSRGCSRLCCRLDTHRWVAILHPPGWFRHARRHVRAQRPGRGALPARREEPSPSRSTTPASPARAGLPRPPLAAVHADAGPGADRHGERRGLRRARRARQRVPRRLRQPLDGQRRPRPRRDPRRDPRPGRRRRLLPHVRHRQPAVDQAGGEGRRAAARRPRPRLPLPRRRRGGRDGAQDGASVLAQQGPGLQVHGLLPRPLLPRHDVRRHEHPGAGAQPAEVRAAAARLHPPRRSLLLPLPVGQDLRRRLPDGVREDRRAGARLLRRRERRHADRRDDDRHRRRDPAAGRVLAAGLRDLQGQRRARHQRRGDHRLRPHRLVVRLRALGLRPRPRDDGQGARERLPAAGGSRRSRPRLRGLPRSRPPR